MRRVFLLLILVPSLLLSITLNDIVEISRRDLERALSLFREYILENPDDENLEDVGRLLYAKKKLLKYEEIKEAVLKEDIDELMRKSRNLKKTLGNEDFEALKVIFPDMEREVSKLLQDPSNLREISGVWKLGLKMKVNPVEFSRKLKKFFMENPFIDRESIEFLKHLENAADVARALVKDILDMDMKEENYTRIVRLFEIAREMGYRGENEVEKQIRIYLDLFYTISYIEEPSESMLKEIIRRYESLSIKKEMLKTKLLLLLSKAKRRGMTLDMHVEDPDFQFLMKKNPKGKSRNTFHYWILIPLPLIIPFLSLRFRSFFYYHVGLKKRALLCYKKVVEKNPTNPDVRLKLALLYEKLGMQEEAMREYEIIKKLS
ncbi:MAG: tetratricopeptide repeat protein [Thermotogaceae bacterium]|nr:tetratricopeptide repeat protein [Thermotogaceae bacterium]